AACPSQVVTRGDTTRIQTRPDPYPNSLTVDRHIRCHVSKWALPADIDATRMPRELPRGLEASQPEDATWQRL
ncbi:hypothetical protein Tco_1007264, partial [Tanacetum coccineum]